MTSFLFTLSKLENSKKYLFIDVTLRYSILSDFFIFQESRKFRSDKICIKSLNENATDTSNSVNYLRLQKQLKEPPLEKSQVARAPKFVCSWSSSYAFRENKDKLKISKS